jgi:zinc protease
VIFDEAVTSGTDPTRAPLLALTQAAFVPGHPYHRSLFGSPQEIARIGRDDLLRFWRARYQPNNMTLVVVGDVARQEVTEAARALFVFPVPLTTGTGRAVELPPIAMMGAVAAAPPDSGPLEGIVRAKPLAQDRGLVTVTLGWRAPSVQAADDVVALDVLLPLLASGAGGSGGRLGNALVRQQQIALAISADYQTRRAPGLLTISAVGPRGSEQAIEKALLAEIRRLREDGVTDDEAERARRAALGATLFQNETFAGQASSLAFYDMVDTYEWAVRYPERLAGVSAADLNRVVRTYLTPDRYIVATVIPRSASAVGEAARP